LAEAGTRKWLVFNDPGNDNLVFKTDSTNRMAIQQGGNVGIGTNAPDRKLDVNGSMKTRGAVYKQMRVVCTSSQSYTVAADDYILLVEGSGQRTINLPAVANELGRVLIIKDATGNSGSGGTANKITLDGASNEQIDNQEEKPMQNNWKSVTIVCGSDRWYRISEFTAN
jgi:hypothetical protein